MIVSLTSVCGAPGVTSWSVLLAAAWPPEADVERVVLEADLDGAVFGARFQLGVEPGAATLVSSARRATGPALTMEDYARRVGDRVWLIPGPESAESARQLWSSSQAAEAVATSIVEDPRVWLVDIGRAGPSGPMGPFFARSVMTIVMCRSEHEALVQVPARVAALRRAGCMVGVLVVGNPAFSLADLQQFFGSQYAWQVEAHRDVVAGSRQVLSERRFKRSQLWRSAVAVASDIADVTVFRTTPRDPMIDGSQ